MSLYSWTASARPMRPGQFVPNVRHFVLPVRRCTFEGLVGALRKHLTARPIMHLWLNMRLLIDLPR